MKLKSSSLVKHIARVKLGFQCRQSVSIANTPKHRIACDHRNGMDARPQWNEWLNKSWNYKILQNITVIKRSELGLTVLFRP